MDSLPLPSGEEIHAAYLQGEEGVVALIAQLVSTFLAILQQQQELIDRLEVRIQALEDHKAQSSRNSHKPPPAMDPRNRDPRANASAAVSRRVVSLGTPGAL